MIIATSSRHSKISIPKLGVFHIIRKIEINRIYSKIIDVNFANNMQNSKLGDANFAISTTCCNDHDWGDSSYDLEN